MQNEKAPKVSRRFLFDKVVVFKTREKVDVEVEVKGTSENTGLHLELGLWREEASAPYVRHRRLGVYY